MHETRARGWLPLSFCFVHNSLRTKSVTTWTIVKQRGEGRLRLFDGGSLFWGGGEPPPPPLCPCRPKFQPPQSEGAGRGLVPLGDQETGEQTFCCPQPPPQQKGGGLNAGQATPPPPGMPSHPHCRSSHGDRGPSGSGCRATSMLGSGTRMVTQQVVLPSHTSEQVDPSTTLHPPPRLRPRWEGCTESAPSGPKKWRL